MVTEEATLTFVRTDSNVAAATVCTAGRTWGTRPTARSVLRSCVRRALMERQNARRFWNETKLSTQHCWK